MRTSERNAEIVALREAGESLESIARAYGITRERVRQIVWRARQDETYASRIADDRRLDLVARIDSLAPGWRPLDALGRALRQYQWEAPRNEVPPIYWEANRILVAWLDGRANETMTVLRLRKLVEVDHATA